MASDSKSKLLLSAFEEFAKNGFFGASTRDIAAKANINISSILYYFGGKRGIYIAALRKIVDVVNNMTKDLTDQYQSTIDSKSPQKARELLKAMFESFLSILCSKDISSDLKKVFLSEYSSPTEEFKILYDELIKPFHDRMANLLNLSASGTITIQDCYFYIIAIFSQLFVLASRKDSICTVMEWTDYDEAAQKRLSSYVISQVDFVLDHLKK